MKFTYEMLTSRVVFGAGSLDQLPDELDRLGLSRVVILSTPEQQNQAQRVASLIGSRTVTIFDQAVMHVPVETQNAAIQVVKDADLDGGVAIGGGSTTGLAKAIALELDFPFIAIPTTYAGSEMTPIWGLTAEGVKQTGRNERIRPRTVIYDPTLTLSLPTQLSGTSGMNAIAHSVEGLYAEDANPIASLMAEESIRALANSLPQLGLRPQDIDVRAQALYGAWLAGVTLGSVGMALHHKLCHTLGGTFNLPHAETHTIVLPHAAAFNFPAAADAHARVARALGTENAAQGLYDLAVTLQIPVALKDLGLQEADLDRAAQLATQNPYYNPRPFNQESIRTLLDNAFHGRRPQGP